MQDLFWDTPGEKQEKPIGHQRFKADFETLFIKTNKDETKMNLRNIVEVIKEQILVKI